MYSSFILAILQFTNDLDNLTQLTLFQSLYPRAVEIKTHVNWFH